MTQATFWLLPHTPIDESYMLVGSQVAVSAARNVRVNVSKDFGAVVRIEGTPFGTFGLEYRQGDISVACSYFWSSIAVRHRKLNGDIGEWPVCPYLFAIPVDSLTAQYHKQCQRWFGTPATQAALEQFIKDIVDALRLYADKWLSQGIVEDGRKLEAKVLGFNREPPGPCSWEVLTDLVTKGLTEAQRRYSP